MFLLILLFGPTMMIFVGLQVLESVYITFLLFYSWLLMFSLLSHSFSKKKTWWSFNKSIIFVGVLSGILFLIIIFGGLMWLHSYFFDIASLQALLEQWGFSGAGIIGLIIVLLVINPILEEVYWRGYLYEKLKLRGNPTLAILLTSCFYTSYHFLSIIPMFKWPLNIAAVIPVFIAGIFWGYIRGKTGSIIGPIISHVLGDLAIICVYLFIVR